MRTQITGYQATLDHAQIPIRRNVFTAALDDLRALVEDRRQERGECSTCNRLLPHYYYSGDDVYDTPWDTASRIVRFCSEKCEDAYMRSGDFEYFYCESCGRTICEQNPRNGWHLQYKMDDDGEQTCLQCYETDILEKGQPRSDYEGRSIRGGMFFSRDNHEPLDKGFEQVLDTVFIASTSDAKGFNQTALEYIDQGYNVVTGYESLATGGSEGCISLFARPKMVSLPGWWIV